jgi:hypothetical protein
MKEHMNVVISFRDFLAGSKCRSVYGWKRGISDVKQQHIHLRHQDVRSIEITDHVKGCIIFTEKQVH